METIAVDMDEVLADTGGKLKKIYENEYNRGWKEEEFKGKDLRKVLSKEFVEKYVEKLNEPGFFRDLALIEDADKVMRELNKKYDVYIVSAAMEFPNSLKDKYEWVMENLPFMSWEKITLCGWKYIVQTDVMIDDRARNFEFFKGRKLLYTAHHNLLEEDYERVNNWQEIADKLL